jgi:hypothetical protein
MVLGRGNKKARIVTQRNRANPKKPNENTNEKAATVKPQSRTADEANIWELLKTPL